MQFDRIVTLDFETYFSKDYSLKSKHLNTSEYVRHPEFKAQCVSIKVDADPVVWYRAGDVTAGIHSIDWSTSALLCHHTAFDGLILSHHYGVVPAFYLDTLSMARAIHSNAIGAGLEEVAQYYKLGNKLPDVLPKTKGIRELPDELMTELGQYCAVDAELCRMIYDEMKEKFPADELRLIDMTIRMFCEPILKIDVPRVEAELERVKENRAQTILASGLTKQELGQNDRLAMALHARGVHAPMKPSPTNHKKAIYAFSKTDLDWLDLRTHEDPAVRALVEGRLVAKSTIGETRAARFLQMAANGNLPVYLSYWGAHTGRWSGGNKANMQNLQRGGELRKSILAPEGHSIVVVDSAQIEARVLAWLANDLPLLALFEAGEDVYRHMAALIYRVYPKDITKEQRFIGKIATLGLGYGMGHAKFRHTLASGAMGPAVYLEAGECGQIVNAYRTTRVAVKRLWDQLDIILGAMSMRRPGHLGPLRMDDEHRVWLPNGMYLQYPGLSAFEGNWDKPIYKFYDYETIVKIRLGVHVDEKEGSKIYGGLFTENIVQALARIIIAEQMIDIDNLIRMYGCTRAGQHRRIVTMTHDEIVVVVPTPEAPDMLQAMLGIMKTSPKWAANLPLSAEGGHAINYSK